MCVCVSEKKDRGREGIVIASLLTVCQGLDFFFCLCFAQSKSVGLEQRGDRAVVELDPAEQTRMRLVGYKECEDGWWYWY